MRAGRRRWKGGAYARGGEVHWKTAPSAKKRKDGGRVEGETEAGRLDRKPRGHSAFSTAHALQRPGPETFERMADERESDGFKSGGWIKGAIRHPGALHRQLGVPEGQKIPAAKLAKAARSDNPTLRKRANLAKTLKKLG